MKKRWFVLVAAIAVIGLILAAVADATAQENPHQNMQMGQQLKVGNKGEVSFSQPTKVGDLLFPPGSYRFVHRVSGEDHFVQFTQTSRARREFGEIKCQVEPLSRKVSQTAITTLADDGGTRRVTRIEVAGENVAHVF